MHAVLNGRGGSLSLPRLAGRARRAAWFEAPAYADMAVVADFNSDRYAITTVALADVPTATATQLKTKRAATFAEIFAYTAASTTARTYIAQDGTLKNDLAANQPRYTWANGKRQLRLENQSMNLLLNSAIVSTQSITLTAVQHTLSFTGTGSVTLSGAASGTLTGTGANNRVQMQFTPTAGSVTVTPTGDVRMGQVETGAFATDWIPTVAAAVTRAIETARLSPLVEAILQRSAGTVLARAMLSRANISGNPRIVGMTGSNLLGVSGNNAESWNGSVTLPSPGLAANWHLSPFGLATSWDATGRSLAANGSSANTDANQPGSRATVWLARDSGSSAYADGYYDLLGISPERPSNATLQALAVPA